MKKLALIATIFIVLAFLFPQPAQADPDPGWLSGWAKRVKLTVDNTDIDAALSDFPILLYISASSGRLNDNIVFLSHF